MTPAIADLQSGVTAIVVSLLNTFWIPAAAAIALALAFRFLPSWNAATRYALSWTLLATVLLAPALFSLVAREPAAVFALTDPEPAAPAASEPLVLTPPASEPSSEFSSDLVPVPLPAAPLNPELWSESSHEPDAASDAVSDLDGLEVPTSPAPLFTLTPGPWTWIVLSLWLAWALYRSACIAQSYRYLRRIKTSAEPADDPLQVRFQALATEHGIRSHARLLISANIAAPIAVGFLRPAVILPKSLAARLTSTELDHLLLHEAGHLARWDDWTNLAAKLIGAIAGLHPIAAWALHRLDREREQACDEWVVAATGASRPYAASLTRLFELTHPRRHLLASAIYEGSSELGARVERILRLTNASRKLSRGALAVTAVLLISGISFGATRQPWFTYEIAEAVPAEPEATTAEPFEIQIPALSQPTGPTTLLAQSDSPRAEPTPATQPPATGRPLTLGLVVDVTRTMHADWPGLIDRLSTFLDDIGPARVFLVEFWEEAQIAVPPTSDHELIKNVLREADAPEGGSATFDALALAVDVARAEHLAGRDTQLLVMTDTDGPGPNPFRGAPVATLLNKDQLLERIDFDIPIHLLTVKTGANLTFARNLTEVSTATQGIAGPAGDLDGAGTALDRLIRFFRAWQQPSGSPGEQVSKIEELAGIADNLAAEQAQMEKTLKDTYVKQESELDQATRNSIADRKMEMMGELEDLIDDVQVLGAEVRGSSPEVAKAMQQGLTEVSKAESLRRFEYGIDYIRDGRQIASWTSREGPLTQSLKDLAAKLREALEISNTPAQGPANTVLAQAAERVPTEPQQAAVQPPDFYVGPLSDLPGDDRKTNDTERRWSESFAASLPSLIKKAEQDLESYQRMLETISLPIAPPFQAGLGGEMQRQVTELRDIAERMKTEPVPIRLSDFAVSRYGTSQPAVIWCGVGGQNWTPLYRCPDSPDQPIRPSDVIRIEVWREPGLTRFVTVGADGRFTMPLIGEVDAAGKTAGEIGQEMERRLKEFLDEPVVQASLVESSPVAP